MYYKLLSNGRKNKTDGNNKANDYPQSKPLLLSQPATTPKTRKTRPENDFRAGLFMSHKAQNPLESRGFRTKCGGGEGDRTPVRNPILQSISGCSPYLEYSPCVAPTDRR